jgi:hypothetical protein
VATSLPGADAVERERAAGQPLKRLLAFQPGLWPSGRRCPGRKPGLDTRRHYRSRHQASAINHRGIPLDGGDHDGWFPNSTARLSGR